MTSHSKLVSRSGFGGSLDPLKVFAIVLAIVFFCQGAIMLLSPILYPEGPLGAIEGVIDASVLTVVLAPFLWFLIVAPFRAALRDRAQLLNRLFDAQDMERADIARELHDGIGQQLTAMLFRLRAVIETAESDSLRDQVTAICELGQHTQEDIRRLSRDLRSAVLDQFGLVDALERLASEFRSGDRGKVDVIAASLGNRRFNRDTENAVYRVAQEAIANAVRHGCASQISVECRIDASSLILQVRDNGIGFSVSDFDPQVGDDKAFGLISMRERVSLLGGVFTVDSVPGEGTTVFARFPT